MDDAALDPVPSASTAGEYVALLREVRRRSGLTYREITRRASATGHWLPASTLATMLGRSTLPRERVVVALLAACGTPEGEVERWLAVRRDIEAHLGERDHVAGQEAQTTMARPTDAAPPVDPVPSHSPAPSAEPDPPTSVPPEVPRPARRRLRLAALALLAVLTAGAAGTLLSRDTPTADVAPTDGCPAVLRQGMYGPCVQGLQERLVAGGLFLPVDGWFGPDTTSRLIAFQALGGLPVSGIADGQVLDELSGDRVAARWPQERVGTYVRKAFPEDPAAAVDVARCLSGLDPYRVEIAADGSRRWGVFQFSDMELSRLGVDRRTALEPVWNVRAARDVWLRTGSFARWDCTPLP
ncbi:peptidoglycan-binding protein [Micromonospora sp. WMMD1155]|uniref:peptidoglycan-binding protein n=1 Tax=Micromonospora sp. WMMD1155 TaxID=3016094 RepID=UPI00249BCC1D|nr:peptidoglycan-binding protein [Micromonospora sp. WMMD1155]WFE49059.1 peptidoglycan-binding protein [Micromonospora sp. WMMD1155]